MVKRIGKILLFFVAGLLLVLALLYLLLRTPYVQTKLVGFITSRIEQRTGVRMKIGGVDFRPVSSLVLEDVYVEDFRRDTMMYCRDLRVKVASFQWAAQRIDIGDITFDDSYFNLWVEREKEGSPMNVELFIDALQSKETERKTILPTEKEAPWEFTLQAVHIRNSRFAYRESERDSVAYGINWTDVALHNLNVDVTGIDISDAGTSARVSGLSFAEKSGFTVEDMGAVVSVCDSILRITDGTIRTARSFIDLRKMEYRWTPDTRAWLYFTTKMRQFYQVEPSRLSFIDLAYFNEVLRGIDNTVGCRGVVSNTVHHLEGSGLDFTVGKSTRILADFKSEGLPDVHHTAFDIRIRKAELNPDDLETVYLPWISQRIPVPGPLHNWRKFDVSGRFRGTIEDFVLDLDSRTSGFVGKAKLAYSPCAGRDSASCSRLSGNFDFPAVRADRLMAADVLGRGSVAGTYEGMLSPSKAAWNMNGKLRVLQVGKGEVKNGDIFLALDNEKMDVLATVDNDTLRGAVMVTCDMSGDAMFLSSKGEVDVADLNDFGWGLTEGKERFRTGFDLVYGEQQRGQKRGNCFGNLSLRDFSYESGRGGFSLGRFSVEHREVDGYCTTNLFSDVADMQVEGRYMSIRPLDFTDKLIRSYMPAYRWKKHPRHKDEGVNFRYTLSVKDVNRVLAVLYPDLSVAPGTVLYANYGRTGGKLLMNMETDSVRYGRFLVQDMRLTMAGDADSLRTVCKADRVEFDEAYRLYNLRDELLLKENMATDKLSWSNWGSETYSGELGVDFHYEPEENGRYRSVWRIHPGVLVLADKAWDVHPSEIGVSGKEIGVRDFRISHGDQYVDIDGDISEDSEKTMTVRVSDINLSEVNRPLLDGRVHVFGLTSGEVTMRDHYGDNLLYADVKVQDWGVEKDTIGTLRVRSVWDADSTRMIIHAENSIGDEVPLRVDGYFRPDTDSLNAVVGLSGIGLDRLSMYASDYFAVSRGGISGRVALTGRIGHPDINGYLSLDSVALTVRPVNTSFFVHDTIPVRQNEFQFRDFRIGDAEGRHSLCNGYYRVWDNAYEVNIVSDNFLLLNTSHNQNGSFYGKVYMSGVTSLNNRDGYMALTVNARPESNSRLYLPLTASLTEESGNFLHFVSEGGHLKREERKQEETQGMQLNANLSLNDNLEIQVVFDPTIGDVLKAKGSGDLRVVLERDGSLNMYGSYSISKGDYLFTLSNLLNKKFVLTPGGTITWNGSLYDATVDIGAVYTLKTSLYELLSGINSTTDKSTKVPVECMLNLSDNFTNPLVRFGINFPTLDSQTKSYLSSLFSSQDEVNKQMFSLLIMNRFYTPDYMSSEEMENRSNGVQKGMTTASEMVSNQLSRWLSKISNNFDIGFHYRPGDNITTDEIELALSTQFLNDRVTISANGNVDVGSSKSVNANANGGNNNIAGDFDLEVKLNKQGTLKLKAYSHTDEKIIYNATETIQGVGVSYQETFDTFRELFNRYFGFLRRKKEK